MESNINKAEKKFCLYVWDRWSDWACVFDPGSQSLSSINFGL